MIIKSDYKMSDFEQTLKNGKKVFDFNKIAEKGFLMNVLITERGARGKTFNAKEFIREQYLKHQARSLWIMNTEGLLTKQISDFTKDFFKPSVTKMLPKSSLTFWDNITMTGAVSNNLARMDYKDNEVLKFLMINHAELMKGARVGYRYFFWDEFNVKANVIRKPIDLFDSLLHSLEDLVSLHGGQQELQGFIFGNNKSLNNPILTHMGITHLEHEISEIRDQYGKPLVLIIAPQIQGVQIKQLEEDNKNNSIYQFSKLIGTAEHSYYNQSLHDEVNNVIRYLDDKETANLLKPAFTLYHKEEYLNVYKVMDGVNKGDYHAYTVKKKDIFRAVFAFSVRDMKESITLNKLYKKAFIKALSLNKVSFEDIQSREIFISAITK